MRPTRFGGARVVGMVAVALLVGGMLAPVVSAQSGPETYGSIAGQWAGPVIWTSGSSSDTIWRINPDGTFSIQTDRYTAVGSLISHGADYEFSYERDGETYTGTLAAQQSNGQPRLVGRGETPNGPMDITLTR